MGRARGGVRRAQGARAHVRVARCVLSRRRRPRVVQAAAACGVRARDPQDSLRQDPAPATAGRPVRGDHIMSEFLRVEKKGPVATLWIDRQPRMNTMTVAMRNAFPGIFAGLEADETVRVVIVRGAGGKAFSAGGDVAEFLTLAPADLEMWGDTLTSAERFRKPVVAAIDGYTMGAGLELAVACDFRIATLRSEFAFPEVRLGMIPGSGGTQRAMRLVGMTRAKLFMMTGRRGGGVGAHHPGRARRQARRGRGRARRRAGRAGAARPPHAEDGPEPRGR